MNSCEHKSVTAKYLFRREIGRWQRIGPDWECDFCHARLLENDKALHEIRSQFGPMKMGWDSI